VNKLEDYSEWLREQSSDEIRHLLLHGLAIRLQAKISPEKYQLAYESIVDKLPLIFSEFLARGLFSTDNNDWISKSLNN